MEKQVKLFLDFLRDDKKLSDNTLQSYRRDIEQYEKYVSDNKINYLKATEETILEYMDYLREENKKESTKEMNSDIIAVCSKCGSTYRFNLKHISFKNGDKYEVGRVAFIEEKYPQVKENIIKNYNSYDAISKIKSENFLTKLIKEDLEGDLQKSEYVFMEK